MNLAAHSIALDSALILAPESVEEIGIRWPTHRTPILLGRDATAPLLTDVAELPEQESPPNE
jgi:hypothetical protein